MGKRQLLPDTLKLAPDRRAYKLEQMARLDMLEIAGLSFAMWGPGQSTMMMTYDASPERESEDEEGEDFYESVIICQLPWQEVKALTPEPKSIKDFRVLPEHEKALDNRDVNMTDDDLYLIIECWRRKQSALTLDFVPRIWGRDGKEVRKPRQPNAG